jgi:poly-gamma-glutamate synthesis protein (capsule biosynthesis protein)
MVSILIGGDLAPTPSNYSLFENGDIRSLLGEELFEILQKADARVFNLEIPITDSNGKIYKAGPNLKAPTSVIKGVRFLNPTVLTLANNHIMDYGKVGLIDTFHILQSNNIKYCGAGNDLNEASKPFIFVKNSVTIGIYSCAEHEFGIAGIADSGANPFDPLETPDQIAKLKSSCDYVIVLYHGGKEHYRYPSPQLQKNCRKLVEKGADLVVCQHSHCVGAYEHYCSGTIIYGQGNFIFDYLEHECWQTSLLIKVNIDNNLFKIDYIPIYKKNNIIRIAENDLKEKIIRQFYERSEKIKDPNNVKVLYNKYSINNIDNYLRTFVGFGKWMSRIDRFILKGLFLKLIYKRKRRLIIQNFIECDAHRELIIDGLKEKMSFEERRD